VVTVALVVGSIISTYFGITATAEAERAQRQEGIAEANRNKAEAAEREQKRLAAGALRTNARFELRDNNPAGALSLVTLAHKIYPDPNFDLQAAGLLAQMPRPVLFGRHAQGINHLAVSADGSRLVSGSNDGTVRLWDVKTGSSVSPAGRFPGPVFAVALSPDGSEFAAAGGTFMASGKVARYATADGRLLAEVTKFPGTPMYVGYTKGGRLITGEVSFGGGAGGPGGREVRGDGVHLPAARPGRRPHPAGPRNAVLGAAGRPHARSGGGRRPRPGPGPGREDGPGARPSPYVSLSTAPLDATQKETAMANNQSWEFYQQPDQHGTPNTIQYPLQWFAGMAAPGMMGRQLAANRLILVPFNQMRAGRLRLVSINLAVPGGGTARLRIGIYNNNASNDNWPTSLVLDCGEIDVSAGSATGPRFVTGIAQNLSADTRYWAAVITNDSNVNISGLSYPIFWGASTTGGTLQVWTAVDLPQAYGTLPANAPTSTTKGSTADLSTASNPPAVILAFDSVT
jgi:hypothetical protein